MKIEYMNLSDDTNSALLVKIYITPRCLLHEMATE